MKGKELFEYQMDTLLIFNETIKYLISQFKLSSATEKNIEYIREYFALYEVMLDTAIRFRNSCEELMSAEKVETIEENLKNLRDTFWD